MTGVVKVLSVLCRDFGGWRAVQRWVDGFPSASPCGRGFHRLSGRADRRSSRRRDESHSACRTCLSVLSKY